eukprot:TRINITY_DN7026_c0_g1_i1.p1 TRINITY_DN7026_c0_g1~~TRINITY_DN7026_c0_g1_i1.p1  ORF type:complete len:185 (+),score=22.67 TRINITY_DN7026_c0_g1_i1:39-593(+)
MIGMALGKPRAEIRVKGTLKLEQFMKLFTSMQKSEVLLKALDNEAKSIKAFDEVPIKKQIANVCEEVFVHIKALFAMHEKRQQPTSRVVQSIIDEKMRLVQKKIQDLYSPELCTLLNNYSKNLAHNPEASLKVNKPIRKLIISEFNAYKKADLSTFSFPHASILDHYVPSRITRRQRFTSGGTS